MSRCKCCGFEKPKEDYFIYASGTRWAKCSKCTYAERAEQAYIRSKQKAIQNPKSNVMKTCILCSQTKSQDDFYKARGTLDGHFNRCKACCKPRMTSKKRDHSQWMQAREVI